MDVENVLAGLEENTKGGTFNFQKAVWDALEDVNYDIDRGGYSVDEVKDENYFGLTETEVYISTRAVGQPDTEFMYKGPGLADKTVGMEEDRDII